MKNYQFKFVCKKNDIYICNRILWFLKFFLYRRNIQNINN